jgi:hypothetical protein
MILLSVSLMIVLIMVGFFVYKAMLTAGSSGETQHLTESGALNVSKQALTGLSTPLQSGVETANFSSLSDNGNVDLKVYNRMVAKALLVSMNAANEVSIWNSTQLPQPGYTSGFTTIAAAANAQSLCNALQNSNNSIAQRLANQLSNQLNSVSPFLSVADSNSTRMLGKNVTPSFQGANYVTSCMNPGANTNVVIDTSILPGGMTLPANALGSKGANNLPYLTGYTPIATGVSGCTVEGASVNPGAQPHLVASRDFSSGTALAKQSLSGSSTAVPPNAFQVQSKAGGNASSILTTAYSMVGALGNTYQASIPDGYIKIYSSPYGNPTTVSGWLQTTGSWGDFNVQIFNRCRQIAPWVTQAQTDALLGTNINPGQTLYMYMNPVVSLQASNPIVISANPPPYFGTEPPADGPYNHYCPNPTNHAVWYLSSGYNNKLGTLIIWSGEVIDSGLLAAAS